MLGLTPPVVHLVEGQPLGFLLPWFDAGHPKTLAPPITLGTLTGSSISLLLLCVDSVKQAVLSVGVTWVRDFGVRAVEKRDFSSFCARVYSLSRQ